MEGIESPLYKISEVKINKNLVFPRHLASIGGIFFLNQWLGLNDFTNRGPIRFPTDDLGGLIEDVRRNKFLDSVTMPRQWNQK